MKRVVIFSLKYSQNVGDGLLCECLEWALHQELTGLSLECIDIAGRTDYGDRSMPARSLALWLLDHLPPVARRWAVALVLTGKLRRLRLEWKERIQPADLAIIGGGGLFIDVELHFPLKIAAVARACRAVGIPVAVQSVGVALPWSVPAKRCFSLLANCSIISITTRDIASIDAWRSQLEEVIAVPPRLCRDPGLLAAEALGSAPPPRKEGVVVGLGLADPTGLELHANEPIAGAKDRSGYFIEILRQLLKRKYKILLFSNGLAEDQAFLELVLGRLDPSESEGDRIVSAPRPTKPADLHQIMQRVDVVVAHRLHATILAYALKRPIVALAWDKKVRNFLESVGHQQFMISGADAAPEHVANKVDEAVAVGIREADHARVVEEARRGVRALAAIIRALPVVPRRQTNARWVVNGRFLAQPVTGVQRYGREIIRELTRLSRETTTGVQLEVIGPEGVERIDRLDGIPFEAAGPGQGYIWVQAILLRAAMGRPILSLSANGPLLARRHILCIHDVNVFMVPTSYSLRFRLFHRFFLPILARKAERVVTVSRYSAGLIADRRLCSKEKIVVIPNGHEHVFQWNESRANPSILAQLSRPFVFMLGSRARHKNMHVVLACAGDLAQLGIDIVVAGGEASCFAAVDGSPDQPNVVRLGRITDDDLAALFRKAMCFAFPSTMEGFGLPALEAMALGCPVVVSDAASLPEVAGDAAIYADPHDPAAWLAQIRLLASDQSLRTKLTERGLDRAKQFSWRESAKKYLDLLEECSERPMPPRPRIAVGIATAGRRDIVEETLAEIGRQTRPPDRLILCPASSGDCPPADDLPTGAEIVLGRKGSCAQRNSIIEAASDVDILVFFDDDFFPEPTYLAEIEQVMASDPSVAMVTGRVLADGIGGPGISPAEARAILHSTTQVPDETLAPTYNGYGCNMAVRMDSVRSHGLRFDENLPLYGWLEDVDFSRRLARNGRIVRCSRARGVHLGSKTGRTPGKRLGYSQVANPVYLMRRGTMRFDRAILQISRNIARNICKSRKPEPWIDRVGRLEGNFVALRDVLSGRLDPCRILEMPSEPSPKC
jgi:glycosyltransferase involved in cell wall biosynthesis/polysaccharide pyruvyl transferase WcaK-like protein/GT2 family glycosyltransferase